MVFVVILAVMVSDGDGGGNDGGCTDGGDNDGTDGGGRDSGCCDVGGTDGDGIDGDGSDASGCDSDNGNGINRHLSNGFGCHGIIVVAMMVFAMERLLLDIARQFMMAMDEG
jgi:hypothetical protein